MSKNVGQIDKAIRIVLGLGLLTLFALGEDNLRWVGLIGLVPLATAFFGVCPLYSLIGFDTCRWNAKK